jgi:hypothetical protein
MPETLDPHTPPPLIKRRFTWLSRALAFLLSPKILVGGVLAYAVAQGYETYKIHRAESHDDTKEVRAAIQKLILPLPKSASETAQLIPNIRFLAGQYDAAAAKAVIDKTIDDLSDRQTRQERQEKEEQLAAEAAQRAKEAKLRAEEAQKAEAEAKARAELQKAEEAKQVAIRKAAEAADQTRRQDELIRNRLMQRAIDRAPK